MNQDEIRNLIDLLRLEGDRTATLGLWEVFFAMALCLACTLMISLVYRFTHRGTGYSQRFAQTLVLISLVTTIIMIVVGSNIARAFSLVGALSIIRFRNAVKETRDVGYIFFAMAVAMAAGTRFYSVALLGTGFISCVILTFHFLDFGAPRRETEHMLRVHLLPGSDVEQVLGATLRKLFESYSQVRLETVQKGLYIEVTLSVRARADTVAATVLEEIRQVNNGLKVSYDFDEHTDPA